MPSDWEDEEGLPEGEWATGEERLPEGDGGLVGQHPDRAGSRALRCARERCARRRRTDRRTPLRRHGTESRDHGRDHPPPSRDRYRSDSHLCDPHVGQVPEIDRRLGHVESRNSQRAAAVVKATTFHDDPDVIAKVSRGLGEAMVGINVDEIPEPHRLAERGW